MDLNEQREEYHRDTIDVDTVDPSPFRQFEIWYREAKEANLLEPNALTLATVAADGSPTQRTVLLKYFDESGMVFFTNYSSRKAQHISGNQSVSLLFQWLPLQRQVEINGNATKVSLAESVKYFARRPRGSQLGAWVSEQSSVVSARSILHNKLAELKQRWESREIPKPSNWGGFRVEPTRFEFWQGGRNRLHDRIDYRLDGAHWQRSRLAP